MNYRKLRLGFLFSVFGALLSIVVPMAAGLAATYVAPSPILAAQIAVGLLFLAAGLIGGRISIVVGLVAVALGCVTTILLLDNSAIAGSAGAGFWALVTAIWLAAALCVTNLSALRPVALFAQRARDIAVPLLFAVVIFYLWEVIVRGAGVPSVLLPAPSAAAARIAESLPVLKEDFVQTFVRGVLIGYVIGCGAGFLIAIVAQRYEFFGRGILPLGNFFAALPLVGVAPIMVMWFGFDWPSKAAVVTLVTFFPMLVNTLAGLSAAGHIERDLMRSYGASYTQTLSKLYIPAALPFIFNALKINATLALIGAIVAEFFGTPTQGIGFRISIEAGRMALDMVWAEIALAAVAGMAFYGFVALAERAATFWHPSYRT
jgi:NitT/TauT family transport system permease protein